jgi:threonine dehydrogenase-like Zn-dependent dehydrogenase
MRSKAKGKGQIELMDYPAPQVKEGYVLLRIEVAGICGSDLKIYADDHPYFPPVILGHEFSGVIEEVGAGFRAGDETVSSLRFMGWSVAIAASASPVRSMSVLRRGRWGGESMEDLQSM